MRFSAKKLKSHVSVTYGCKIIWCRQLYAVFWTILYCKSWLRCCRVADRVRYDGEQSGHVSEFSPRLARETRLHRRQRSSTRRGLPAGAYSSFFVFFLFFLCVYHCASCFHVVCPFVCLYLRCHSCFLSRYISSMRRWIIIKRLLAIQLGTTTSC